jgi:hypothetical protein
MIQSTYLRTFALSAAIVVALFLAFIWTVDPYGVSPLRFTSPGFNSVKPKRVTIERLIKPYEVWRYQPRTVFLGTSRFYHGMDPAVLEGTRFSPAYNAAIPASRLVELSALLEEFFEFDKNLRVVFLELFLYQFMSAESPHAGRSLTQLFREMTPLFLSGSAVFHSLQTVFSNISGQPTAQVAAGGHFVPPATNHKRTFNPAGSIGFYVEMHETHLKTMTLEPYAFEVLERMVDLCRKNNAELILVIPPTHPLDEYRLWSFGQWPVLEQWTRRLSTFDNVFSFAQYNEVVAEPATREVKYWYDPLHFNPSLGRLMLRSFLGASDADIPSNLLWKVTPTTVEALIHERRMAMIRWIGENRAYATAFDEAKAAYEARLSGLRN